ncbi:hypothetical protein D3C76_1717750 [compost metagenome]
MSSAYDGDLNARCSPNPVMKAGRLRARAATSLLVMIIAAPPATGMTISRTCSGSATILLARTCSMLNGWP